MGYFIILAGAFSVAGAAFDWDWFMNHRKARFWVSMLGRLGARVFYGLLGVGLMVLGAGLASGMLADGWSALTPSRTPPA